MFRRKYWKIHEEGKEIAKTISYRSQFIDSAGSMTSLLSNIVNNLTERIHKIKCKYGHDDKKCEVYGIKNTKTVTAFLNTHILKMI